MGKKKSLIIGGSVAGAALIALIVVSIALANRPSALIARALANTISDAEKIELFAVADDVANGGSVAVSANLDSIANDDIYVQAKMYSDAKNLKSAYELSMIEDDEEIINGKLIFNQDKIAVNCPVLFDGSYGINFKNLEKNLPGSIFDPDEETDYSLSDEEFEYFMNLKDTVKNDKNLERDITKMSDKYRQLLINTLVKYAEVAKSAETVNAGGDKIPCNVIELSIDEESLALVMQDIIDYANEDKDLEELIRRVGANGSFEEDADEVVDSFYDTLDDIEKELEELEDKDINIELSFFITKSGRRIARIDGVFEVEDNGREFSLVLGKNVAKTKEISFTASEIGGERELSAIYTVDENSSKAYTAEIEIKKTDVRTLYIDYDFEEDYPDPSDTETETYTEKSTVKIDWDKKGGDLEIKLDSEYDDIVIKGTLVQKGDTYTFVLTNVRSDGSPVPYIKSLEITVIIDRRDPTPNVSGGFTEITTMDKRDFKHFVSDIEDGIDDIIEKYFDDI